MTARAWWYAAGALYAAGLVVLLSWPEPIDGLDGVSPVVQHFLAWCAATPAATWITYPVLEQVTNVLVFVPAGLVARRLIRLPSAALLAIGVAISLSAELVQAALLPHRFATASDVIANSLGFAIGVICTKYLPRR